MYDCADPNCKVTEQLYLPFCTRCERRYCKEHINTHECALNQKVAQARVAKVRAYVPPPSKRCPDCGGPIVEGEGFETCPVCGYSVKIATTKG